MKQATGRDLTLQGRIRLGLSLQPTLTVQGVAFANPPGFSRPQMATLERLDLKLALIPLLSHRVEIDRLVLVKPDILLETDAQGPAELAVHAGEPPAGVPAAPPPAAAQDGDGDPHQRRRCADRERHRDLARWPSRARAPCSASTACRPARRRPMPTSHLSMSANYNGTPFTLAGEFGPLTRLQDRQASAPGRCRRSLEAVGAKLTVDGTVTQPTGGPRLSAEADGEHP